MSITDWYDYVLYYYGQRKAWVSDIASKLGITKEQARYITVFLGFHRGKGSNPVKTLNQFITDPKISEIYKRSLESVQ